MFLKKGERGLLVGKTGSGKTQNGIFQLRHTPLWPKIIFDSKIDDAFFSAPDDGDTIELVEGLPSFLDFAKKFKNKMPDFLIVRPTSQEFVDPELMDNYLQAVYLNFGKVFSYIDEITTFHRNGRALPGLVNLLTRGRSKGKTTLMGSQRPAFISRFCVTETDRFYMHLLTDKRDRVALGEVVPDFEKLIPPPKFHFWHYSHADHEKPELFLPVPETKVDTSKIFKVKWI